MKKLTLISLSLILTLLLPAFAWGAPNFFGTKAMALVKPKPPVLVSTQKWSNYRTRISVKGAKNSTDTYTFYYADWSGASNQDSPQWLKENGDKSSNIAPDLTGNAILRMHNPSETGTNAIVYMITITDKDGNESEPLLGRVDTAD